MKSELRISAIALLEAVEAKAMQPSLDISEEIGALSVALQRSAPEPASGGAWMRRDEVEARLAKFFEPIGGAS